jgi:hypothetical protein
LENARERRLWPFSDKLFIKEKRMWVAGFLGKAQQGKITNVEKKRF